MHTIGYFVTKSRLDIPMVIKSAFSFSFFHLYDFISVSFYLLHRNVFDHIPFILSCQTLNKERNVKVSVTFPTIKVLLLFTCKCCTIPLNSVVYVHVYTCLYKSCRNYVYVYSPFEYCF